MRNEILILGKGYFSSRLHEELGLPVSERRILSLDDAEDEVKKQRPRVLINCIGYIGRNVDDCELDKQKALFANTFVPIILGEVCLRHQVRLVHISTGCIYHYDYAKDPPIDEEKEPDFFELYYSRTKIYAEQALRALSKKCHILILRPRVPLDNRPTPKNLLTKLLKTRRVINLANSSSYMPDFARAAGHLINIGARGIYNVVNKNPLFYPDLMEAYKKYVPGLEYEVIDFNELNLIRTNNVLSVDKLESTGFKVRDIKDVLEECVTGYLKKEKNR
ncbi:MAG: sugar nucleotide-binding protein [Candidatus Omnitrophota bacterium]|jgi:dTDP-4-dehydrorhamnose reductase